MEKRRISNRRPLASVMGVLMVVDPQPTARYQPAGLYISIGALKNRGGLERGRRKKPERKETQSNHRNFQVYLQNSHTRNMLPLTNTEPRKTREETGRERVERCSENRRGPKNRETGREQNDSVPALPLLSKRK